MKQPDNSVARLHTILALLQKKATNKNEEIRLVLARVFEVSPDDFAQLLEIYYALVKLVMKAKDDVANISDIDQSLYLEPFQRLEKGFSANSLIHPWTNFVPYLDATTMKSLQFCADTLSRKLSEQTISGEDLSDLQKEVNELLELVMKINVDEKLRSFLVEKLEEIRHAILYYRINGGDGLKEAFENIIGASFVFTRNRSDEDFSEDGKTAWQRFGKIIVILAGIVEFANNLKGLTGFTFPSLPGMP